MIISIIAWALRSHLPFGEPIHEDRTAMLTGVARSHGVDVDALRKIVEG